MTPDVLTRTFVIRNTRGLHARPATALARALGSLDSTVTLAKDGQKVNGRSVISILILAATPGSTIRVEASGPQRQQAMEAVAALFETNFGEE